MGNTQTGVRIPDDLLRKVKFIAWHDVRKITAIIVIALQKYVDEWELNNGSITEQRIVNAKIK